MYVSKSCITLAEMAGLPDTHISAMERGLALPNLLTVIRLAVAPDCKVSALTSAFDKSDLASLLPRSEVIAHARIHEPSVHPER